MPDEFTEAVRAYQRAAWPVLTDPAIWREEAQRAEAPRLDWPPQGKGTHFQRLLCVLVRADIDVLLVLLRDDEDPRSPAWPPDLADPKLQVLFRVAHRSMLAGERAMVDAFGGERITGKREYINLANEQWTEEALRWARRLKLTRDEAFALLDIPRRQGFRAAKRAVKRRK